MAQTIEGAVGVDEQSQVARPPVGGSSKANRLNVFMHAFFFVLGFTAVFTLIGSAAGLLGRNLDYELLRNLQRFGAIMLVIFAMVTLGLFNWIINKIRNSI